MLLAARTYRKYYKRMKEQHTDEWRRLMNKDEVVAGFGEWTRWPIGSSYFMMSILQRREDLGDGQISALKRRFFFAILGSVLFFLTLVGLIALLPYPK
jgi:hypothetical protein